MRSSQPSPTGPPQFTGQQGSGVLEDGREASRARGTELVEGSGAGQGTQGLPGRGKQLGVSAECRGTTPGAEGNLRAF